jgi:hypothetical protein
MPGSQTAQSQAGPCAIAPACVAFCHYEGIGAPDCTVFAAQWLACTHPCQRFVRRLATTDA